MGHTCPPLSPPLRVANCHRRGPVTGQKVLLGLVPLASSQPAPTPHSADLAALPLTPQPPARKILCPVKKRGCGFMCIYSFALHNSLRWKVLCVISILQMWKLRFREVRDSPRPRCW